MATKGKWIRIDKPVSQKSNWQVTEYTCAIEKLFRCTECPNSTK